MKKIPFCVVVFTILVSLTFVFVPAMRSYGQEQSPSLREGIEQYREGSYEEAIEILEKVRSKDPTSSTAAFFLGLAYKQAQDYAKALVNFQDAAQLKPRIKEAFVEIIDSLYQLNRIDEAKRWIQIAEQEGVYPARVAFLKGLVFAKENKNQEAIEAFEKAKQQDPSLSQSCDFQIAMLYMRERKLDKAKERLQTVITRDPLSDLATFARQYKDIVEKRMYLERPLRLTLGVFGGYDTNIVTKPTNDVVAGDITDERGRVLQSYLRIDYIPVLKDPWILNASYSATLNVNQKHTHSHDFFAQTFSLSPGINFGRFATNLNVSFTNVLLRTDPDTSPPPDSNPGYKRYLDDFSIGPIFRVLIRENHILEIHGGYDKKEFYNQKKTSSRTDRFWENNRDAVGPKAYLSWIWLFTENAFLNVRYDYSKDHADGMYWDNEGHRVTANLIFPLLSREKLARFGPLSMQVTASYLYQRYTYEQPFQDNDGSSKSANRKDKSFTGSIGINWEFYRNTSFILQYTGTNCNSNIPANDYHRNLYTAGVELRF
ncbi:MAG: tetratricopeptide repeat protein [Syntrophales bacterium]|nr:tetratricopeptide repeat protein [Syntrophales bacterium]